jgi:hypothetical protein
MESMHESGPQSAVSLGMKTAPSRSRMLAGYLAHIEHLLRAQWWEEARRQAADLPHIAVALTHPQFLCSAERVRVWCDCWLGATQCATWNNWLSGPHPGEHVPAAALKRLRRQRFAPPSCRASATSPLPHPDTQTVRFSVSLVDATQLWYAQCACHDPTVQSNLARLAVLR